MKIAITSKFGLHDPHRIVQKSAAFLRKSRVQVDISDAIDDSKAYDLILVFGGDGSVLRTLQHLKDFNTPLLPINMGRLGFFSQGLGKDYQKIIKKVLHQSYTIESRMLLRCSVLRSGKRVFSKRALNEVVIARDSIARMITLKTMADGLQLATYVADGLIIATPTGSTGYTLSAGGPIMSPELDSLVVTPIAPHSFTQRSIVLLPSSRLKVQIGPPHDRVCLTLDGQIAFRLKAHDVIEIKRSSKRLKLISLAKNSYYRRLRAKLSWGTHLR